MSSVGPVVDCYKEGMEAMQKKRYSQAARFFLVCSYHYEYGELPFFMSQVKEYGEDAMCKYYDCLEKLSNEEQQALEELLQQCKHCGWREKASFIYDTVMEENIIESLETAKKDLESSSQQDPSINNQKLKKIEDLESWLEWIRNRQKEILQ